LQGNGGRRHTSWKDIVPKEAMAEKFSEKFSGPVNPACPGAALPSEYACAPRRRAIYVTPGDWRNSEKPSLEREQTTMSATTGTSEGTSE